MDTSTRSFQQLRKEHSFPKQKFVVTSLGEVLRRGDGIDDFSVDPRYYLSGCVNTGDFVRELGHEPSKEEWDFAFHKDLMNFCRTVEEYKFARRVWKMQKYNDGRFRVWGYIAQDDTPYIWLVTEFRELVSNKPFWRELIDLSRRLKGGVRNINKAPHCDHVIENYGKPDQKDIYGPDHGKLERQVEMYWNISQWSVMKLLLKRYGFALGTQKLWETTGVGVC